MTILSRDYPRGLVLSLLLSSSLRFCWATFCARVNLCPHYPILATLGDTAQSPTAAGPLYTSRCLFEGRGQNPAPHLHFPPLCQGHPEAQFGSCYLLNSEPTLGAGPLPIMSKSQLWGHNLPVFHLTGLILLSTHIHPQKL